MKGGEKRAGSGGTNPPLILTTVEGIMWSAHKSGLNGIQLLGNHSIIIITTSAYNFHLHVILENYSVEVES